MKKILSLNGKFYSLHFLYTFATSFFLSTYIIYLNQSGMGLDKIGILNSIFLVLVFFLEIPTGLIADVFGRKISFLVSCGARSIAMIVFMNGINFMHFALAMSIAAFAETCHSGAFISWVYDEIKESNKDFNINTIFPILGIVDGYSSLFAGFLGAHVAIYSFDLLWMFSSIIFIITFILALYIPEKRIIKYNNSSLKNLIYESITEAALTMLKSRIILFIMILLAIREFSLTGPGNFWQPLIFFNSNNTSHINILGYVWAIMSIVIIIANKIAYAFPRIITLNYSIVFIFFSGTSLLMMNFFNSQIALSLLFLLHIFFNAIIGPFFSSYLHEQIPSKFRATIASCISLATSSSGSIGALVFGFIASSMGIISIFPLAGIIYLSQVLLFVIISFNGVRNNEISSKG